MSMSNLRTVESRLPPGFRFHPKDDELICDYLIKKFAAYSSSNYKAANDTFSSSLILIEVDLNKCEPWDIPEIACVGGKEWYFYSQRDRKYATGMRTNRATVSGYWKATGKDRAVVRRGHLVGMRKTLVFYRGRAPKGRKTNWVMHEFRLEGPYFAPPTIISSKEEDWVLCRVFHKSGNDHQLCSRSTSKANNNRAASSQGGSGETESSSTITLPPLSLMMDSSYINNINFGQTDPDHKTISTDQLEEEEEEEEDDDKDDTNLDHHDHIKDNSSNNIKDANANNYNVELQVPCFSIFSQNVNQNQNQSQSQSQSQNQNQNQNQTSMLTAAASNFPHIFSMENAGNNTTATTMISYNYNYNYNNNNNAIAPPTMLTFQDGVVGGCTGSLLINPPSLSSSSTTVYNEADVEDNKQVVIRAMLSQLTKMEGTHNPYSNINYYYNMIPNPKQLVNGNGKGSSPVSYGDSAESYLSDVGVGLGLPAPTTVLWNNHHRH